MRKMATIQTIRDITPIEGADAIVLAHVNGWISVVKKDEFTIGQKIIFCEIDSWIPHSLASFLSKGKEPREYLGVKGERLRSVKLRGQLSQGLILPIEVGVQCFVGSDYDNGEELCEVFYEGADVSETLGIVKYEPPIPAQLAGQVRGNFPSLVSKTDEERVQNIRGIENYLDEVFVETEKLHGTSVSFVLNEDGDLEVCSRNLSLKEDENNLYWKLAKQNNALELLNVVRNYYEAGGNSVVTVAIQGEGVGQGVQKGWEYGIQVPEFFMFTIQVNGVKIPEEDYQMFANAGLNVKYVPEVRKATIRDIVGEAENISGTLLKYVEGKSAIDGKTIREGSVFRSLSDSSVSFKVVSNQFLLKGGE